MSENDMPIDPIHYGGLVQQVEHLAKAQEDHNAMQAEHRRSMEEQREATRDLASAVRELTDRLAKLEGSPFMQPAKLGKAALTFVALVILLAIKGIAGTLEIIAKAMLP